MISFSDAGRRTGGPPLYDNSTSKGSDNGLVTDKPKDTGLPSLNRTDR